MSLNDVPKTKPIIDLIAVRLLLWRNWRIIAACLLAGVCLGGLMTLLSPKSYTASASGVVVVRGSNDIGGVMTGDSVAKSKATQFQSLAKSRTVAQEALKLAGISGSPDAAAASVTVAVPEDTAQINISVAQPTGARAANLANAWVTALAKNVQSMSDDQIATPTGSGAASTESVIAVKPYVTAPTPTAPSSPNLRLNLLFGALLGLTGALLWVFLRAKSDRRIRDSDTIERAFGLSVIGTLPKRTDDETRAFLLDSVGRRASKSDFRSVESFNELRANLQFMNPDRPPKAVVVSSALPGEGKSTVAANLAISIAEMGRKVVLVDGDLRRPTVALSFGLVPEVGVTNAVLGQGPIEDCLQEVHGAPNLKVMTSGKTPPNPSEIVASEAFATMIDTLSKNAFVVIDAPPLIPVTDGAVMARRFDGCMVVLDVRDATKDSLTKALSVLDKVDADVLGVVLNRVPTSKLESSQYGYYGDYYYSQSDDVSTSKTETAAGGLRGRHALDEPQAAGDARGASVVDAPANVEAASASKDAADGSGLRRRRRQRD